MKTSLQRFTFLGITLSLFFTFVMGAFSEELPSPIQEKIGAFFERLQKGEVQPAIEDVIKGGMISQNSQQVQNLVSQINNSISIYGTIRGSSYVKSMNIADSLCKAMFISKHANYPLRWTFIFYKSEAEWVLVNIEFDDNVEALF